MKIAVIFTGGTIGTVIKGNWMSTDESAKYALISNYKKIDGETEFVCFSPYTILSENLSAKELNLLQKEVKERLSENFDGIIVTHGTDTLHYTAAALGMAFTGCRIPVILVSSDYPLEDERANGNRNFEAAVAFIKSKKAAGVFVSYKNTGEEKTNIHIPSEMLRHGELTADIYPITGKPFAEYSQGITLLHGNSVVPQKSLGIVEYADSPGILVIDSHPGDSFEYSLNGIKAVIINPYHSATLDTANEKLRIFCAKANKNNVPVFVTGVRSEICYESTKAFESIGIRPLTCSFVSAYMEIWAVISLGKDLEDFVCSAGDDTLLIQSQTTG